MIVGVLRNSLSLLLLLCVCAAPALAVDLKKPNATIHELIIGFGRDAQRSEQAAIAKANVRAIDANYKIKNISISKTNDRHYTLLNIEHKIYVDEDESITSQMTVGFGRDIERALDVARQKALSLIHESNRELARIGNDADERAESRSRTNSERYWLKSIRFTKYGDDWACFIKFEYLEDKKVK